MNHTKGILAAGTFSGLVLITILALGFDNLRAGSNELTVAAPTATEVSLPETNGMTDGEALQAWQNYSAELEQTVRTMQDRDAAYQQQLNAANQTILQLQDQVNSANSTRAIFRGDDDRYEHEEHQYQGYEYGEYDD